MRKKLLIGIFCCLSFLATTAFSAQEPAQAGLAGWPAFFLVLLIILVLGVFLVMNSSQTPANTARYHLDHGTPHELSSPAEGQTADQGDELAGVIQASGSPPAHD